MLEKFLGFVCHGQYRDLKGNFAGVCRKSSLVTFCIHTLFSSYLYKKPIYFRFFFFLQKYLVKDAKEEALSGTFMDLFLSFSL